MKGKRGIKTAKEIREEVRRRYDKNPEGWKVSLGRDSENYLDSLFLQDNKFWMIKEFALNPYRSIGFGIKGKIKRGERLKKPKSPAEFGLRPLVPEQIEALLEGNFAMIREILASSPLPSEKCFSSPLVMEGPVSMSHRPVFISKAQEKLDRKLRRNLRELISREYPGITRSYR